MSEKQRGYYEAGEGVKIFYEFFFSSPSRPTLVLINGLLQCLFNWYPLKKHLSSLYNLLLFDMRGQGKTQIEEEADISLDLHCLDLEGLLRHLSLNKVSLVGMSCGGYVALMFAANHPQMVEKIVLLGVGDGTRVEMIVDDWSNMVNLLGDFAFLKFVLPSLFSAEFIEKMGDKMDGILDGLIERNHTTNLIKWLSSLTPHPRLSPLLKEVSSPILHIIGTEDALIGPSRTEKTIKETGKDHRVVLLPGVGHSVIDEAPEQVAHHIREFI